MSLQMGTVFQGGVLLNATPLVIKMSGAPLPATVTLKSSAGARLIELSTDDGLEYFTPVVDNTSPTMLVLSLRSSVSHVRITGAANDTWNIR